MSKKVIGIIYGSLRKESFSKKIAKNLLNMAPDGFEFRILDISDLPLYNPDLEEEGVPESYTRFREEAGNIDGFIFVTPEYNRSLPAVMKNALDVGSRPYGKSVWDGKPGGIISVSPGKMGAFGANHHLRQPLVFLNVLILQQPEAYIGDVSNMLDAEGNLTDESTVKFIRKFVHAYIGWVELVSK